MGNMQAIYGRGVHPLNRVQRTLVIANYATVAKPSLVMPCKYIDDWNDVDIRVETATGNIRGIVDATSTRNMVVVELRAVRGEQIAAAVTDHTQAQVVAAIGDHTQAQVVASLADHAAHAHTLITQGVAGAVGIAIGWDVGFAQIEDAGGVALHTMAGGGATAIQDTAAAMVHAGGADLTHVAGGATVAHATVANAYAEDREIADQAVAATIIVLAKGHM